MAISQVIAVYIILQWSIEFTVPLKTNATILLVLTCVQNRTHVTITGLVSRIKLLKPISVCRFRT